MIKNEYLKIKIAKLFYQDGYSKIEIGKKLRISRLKVANLLENAIKDGIVNITINEPEKSYIDIENKIEKKFGINRAIVVDTSNNYEETKINIGKAAASYFEEAIYDNDVIGVAWGSTLFEMVNALPKKISKKNITIVQITGGSNQIPMDINASELTRRIAKAMDAKSYYLHAPAIVNNKEVRDLFISEAGIKNTIEIFEKINFAVVGIGSTYPVPSTILYRDGIIKNNDFNDIAKNCVGDINSFFYNESGIECKTVFRDTIIGMSLDQLKKVRNVMALAGGEHKVDAIYGALRGRLVNIIITDLETSKYILDKEN